MVKADNVIAIPIHLDKEFFQFWFNILHPFHGLSKSQVGVVAALVQKRFELSHSIIDPKVLDKVLMSSEVREQIREGCKMSKGQFQVTLSILRKKGVIIEERINPKFIPRVAVGSDNFKLLIVFKFLDDDQASSETSE